MESPTPTEPPPPEKVGLWKQFRLKTADWQVTQWAAAAAIVTFSLGVIERLVTVTRRKK